MCTQNRHLNFDSTQCAHHKPHQISRPSDIPVWNIHLFRSGGNGNAYMFFSHWTLQWASVSKCEKAKPLIVLQMPSFIWGRWLGFQRTKFLPNQKGIAAIILTETYPQPVLHFRWGFLNVDWYGKCPVFYSIWGKFLPNQKVIAVIVPNSKLYIPSTLNIDFIQWHPQLIVDAVKC